MYYFYSAFPSFKGLTVILKYLTDEVYSLYFIYSILEYLMVFSMSTSCYYIKKLMYEVLGYRFYWNLSACIMSAYCVCQTTKKMAYKSVKLVHLVNVVIYQKNSNTPNKQPQQKQNLPSVTFSSFWLVLIVLCSLVLQFCTKPVARYK